MDDLVAALGTDSSISKSEVSRICAGLHEVVTAVRRPSDGGLSPPLRQQRLTAQEDSANAFAITFEGRIVLPTTS